MLERRTSYSTPHDFPTTSARVKKINSFLTKMQRDARIRVNMRPFEHAATAEGRTRRRAVVIFLRDRSCRCHEHLLVRQTATVRCVQELAYPHRRHRAAEQIALRLGHRAIGADQ